MADLDLDALEDLMKQEEKVKKQEAAGTTSTKEEDSKRDRKRSRSRSTSHKKSKKSHKSHKSHRRSSSRDKKKKHRRSSRSSSGEKKEEPAVAEDPMKKQEEMLRKQIEEAKRQAEEAQRDDCTILVNRLPLQANEKDIYMFFAKDKGVGKIRDVRLIRDQRTNKSKGIAYVEFYTPESVLLAMALSGTQLMGQTINIQASQAEKNRAAAASKYKKDDTQQGAGTLGQTGNADKNKKDYNNKVYVGGLVEALNMVTESDIRQWFSPFGDIDSIDLPKDPISGRNKGHAVIEYSRHRDAKNAVREMNGFDVLGRQLKCSIVTDQMGKSMIQQGAGRDMDLEEDGGGQFIHSSQSRLLLMQKLSREDTSGGQDGGQAIKAQNYTNHPTMAIVQSNAPTNCVLLNNMFDPALVDLRKDPAFYLDIKEQVEDVCRSQNARVEKVWVEQNSAGNVWVRFARGDIEGASKTVMLLNQRYFDSRLITANYVPEGVFNSKVKER